MNKPLLWISTLCLVTLPTNVAAAQQADQTTDSLQPRRPSSSRALLGMTASSTAAEDTGSADGEVTPKQDQGNPDEDHTDAPSDDDSSKEKASAQQPKEKQTDGARTDPWFEKENETYRFIGLRARAVVIPKFMFSLYQADGGQTVVAPQVGPEYVSRRNGFEYAAWLTYSSYAMHDVPFKAKSDPDVAYELVSSELKVLSIGADFLWSRPLGHGTAVVFGGSFGLGAVFGDLHRNQAYPPNGVPGDPDTYVKCPAPGAGSGGYCGNDNDHYGDYTEPNWFDGGSKPVIFPWIALPQVGFRWKPSSQFVMRFDTGLSFPGPFFFGLSGAYGLPE